MFTNEQPSLKIRVFEKTFLDALYIGESFLLLLFILLKWQ
jgi:hypothetical protein